MRFATTVSDRVVLLDKGHVVYVGTIDEFQRAEDIQKRYLAV